MKKSDEPQKLFSLIMNYSTYEELKGVARERDISTGEVVRKCIDAGLPIAKKDESW